MRNSQPFWRRSERFKSKRTKERERAVLYPAAGTFVKVSAKAVALTLRFKRKTCQIFVVRRGWSVLHPRLRQCSSRPRPCRLRGSWRILLGAPCCFYDAAKSNATSGDLSGGAQAYRFAGEAEIETLEQFRHSLGFHLET